MKGKQEGGRRKICDGSNMEGNEIGEEGKGR